MIQQASLAHAQQNANSNLSSPKHDHHHHHRHRHHHHQQLHIQISTLPICITKHNPKMCKSKKKVAKSVIKPSSRISMTPSSISSSSFDPSSSTSYNNLKDSSWKSSSSFSSKSRTSLSNDHLRLSILPEQPHIYDFSEIRSATNNFLLKPFSSSSSSTSWRCVIRSKNVVIVQRKFRHQMDTSELIERLTYICKSHHASLVKLKGASISGNYIYLVYDFVQGASLADCLRNPRNPSFTILSTWLSRVQVASDVAHGIDYIHNSTGLGYGFVHNHIKSSSIIVTELSLAAKICHFGTAELCGEMGKKTDRNKVVKFEGTRGYMAPEFQVSGVATQKSDVYAFGVVILELLSGEEVLRYFFDEERGGYVRTSVIESAREAVEGGGGVRRWVDKRLKDSYPVEVVEKLVRLGLECVAEDPDNRPGMGKVVGRLSQLFLESQNWAEKMGTPLDLTVSLAPR